MKKSSNGGNSSTNVIINENSSDDQVDVGEGGDLVDGFSWPPRSYTCTFCKREFRSAQALGGHMNVHRRDRARLRHMPFSRGIPLHPHNFLFNLNLDPHPNPNPNSIFSPNFSSNLSSTPTKFPSITSTSILRPPLNASERSYLLRSRGCPNFSTFGVCNFSGIPDQNEGKFVNRSEMVKLNMEIGLLGESESDDLDLELRLGCA